MIKRFVIYVVLPILVIGCATTPDSIKRVSAVELQMQDNIKKNFDRVLESYDDEMRHWQSKAFAMHVTNVESRLVDTQGKVDLAAYKKAISEITAQLAANEARYDKNLDDVRAAMHDKFAKARYLSMLIDEFENSTGVAPETVEAFTREMSTTGAEIAQLYEAYQQKQAEEEALKPPSMRDQLELLGNDVFDRIYEQIRTGLETVTLPAPADIGTLVPMAPAE